MLFNSPEYALFLFVTFVLYWFVFQGRTRAQNAFLLVASYVFYAWWDELFLLLIIASSVTDYVVGAKLDTTRRPRARKALLLVSLSVNVGLLGFFKYFNFFVDSFVDAFALIGLDMRRPYVSVILPVGISFYTFQTLSYTIDIYRRRISSTRDPVAFFTFVAFFPQLVAGPIERASNLLPQFCGPRTFDYERAKDGMRQILWGLFKKVVIADTCAIYADEIFENPDRYSGSVLLLGAVYFAFQIYGDFSGYSDIAIGTARLFGIDLMRNFAYPYFSRDIAEFWRRWHISLSTWFRDYVYIPMGGSRADKGTVLRNIIIVFVVSGLWHGANWTFVAWGFLNGLYFVPLYLLGRNRQHTDVVARGSLLPSPVECVQMATTFFLTLLAWVFFRAATINLAFAYLRRMLSESLFDAPSWGLKYVPMLLLFTAWEWRFREKEHALQIEGLPSAVRHAIYIALVYLILAFMGDDQAFIYFQF